MSRKNNNETTNESVDTETAAVATFANETPADSVATVASVVVEDEEDDFVIPDYLKLDKKTVSFVIDEGAQSETLNTTRIPAKAKGFDEEPTTWKAVPEGIVKLSATTGDSITISPLKAGNTTITAQWNSTDCKDTCEVTVTEKEVTKDPEQKEEPPMEPEVDITEPKDEETTTPTVVDVTKILDENWTKVGRSMVGPAYLHDTTDTISDADLLDMFSDYGVRADKEYIPTGEISLVFSARLKDTNMDHSHQGEASKSAWVGLAFIPTGKQEYTNATYGVAYGATRPEIETKSLDALEENVNHAEGENALKGIALYFDINKLLEELKQGNYMWISLQWKTADDEDSTVVYRVKLDLSVIKTAEELADPEVLRGTVGINALSVTETVTGDPIPDWAFRNKYRIVKILDDRVIVKAGLTYVLALRPEDIRA